LPKNFSILKIVAKRKEQPTPKPIMDFKDPEPEMPAVDSTPAGEEEQKSIDTLQPQSMPPDDPPMQDKSVELVEP
jgi:hypothetical protein